MKVLLVDDYRASTEVLADVARSMGHAVSQAYSGVEALVVTTGEGPFDLILLDIALADISGHEVCLRLRAGPTDAEDCGPHPQTRDAKRSLAMLPRPMPMRTDRVESSV